MLGTVMLGLAASPAFAQEGDDDNGNGSSNTNGGETDSTSTDATGTGGAEADADADTSAGESSTSMGGESSGDTDEHNCQGGERWNAQSAACEAEAGPGSTQPGPATGQ
jgi:hypothetical protein